ncbi:MAG: manganese efflux pump MntP family protein [Desulfobulbaceae bacterium]|nr:manganese efflux pump MntP family protein [Desulfobulbaceae bacterium]
MDFFTILLIALALAVDAFAVAVAAGVSLCAVSFRQLFRLSWHFGLFQAGMTLLGWGAGLTVRHFTETVAPWLAFVLLGFVGGRMIVEALREGDEEKTVEDPTRGKTLILLSVATSIDALAVGISFAILNAPVWFPALVIGIVASLLTIVGLRLGCLVGAASRLGARAEILGGIVLIGIGCNILHQHGVF